MNSNQNTAKPYDLEERTFRFASEGRTFIRKLSRTIANIEDAKQFILASGSVGANYIEANEAIGKRDFIMKIKTCRREAKESRYWLRLLEINDELGPERDRLISEAVELMKIFGTIARKSE